MNRFSRHHYVVIAEKIQAVLVLNDLPDTAREMADSFIKTFSEDDPFFKEELFLRACGL